MIDCSGREIKTPIVVVFLQLFLSGAATFCCDEVCLIVGEVAMTVRPTLA